MDKTADNTNDCTLIPNTILKALPRMPNTTIHLVIVALRRARAAAIATAELVELFAKHKKPMKFIRALHDRVDEVERVNA